MASHLANSTPVCRRRFLTVALFAMALFVAGPQMGSLDVDGDGFPEVPVAVVKGPVAAFSSTTLNHEPLQRAVRAALNLRVVALGPLSIDGNQSDLALHGLGTYLCCSCVLRC